MANTPSRADARDECYARIRKVMKDSLTRYYKRFPDRLDQRGEDAVQYSTRGLEEIFKILDGFDIRPCEKRKR